MSPDRQILRLMAAMILAIIAYVAPSAVQAHEGHAHHGHHMASTQPKTAATATRIAGLPAKPAVRAGAATWSKVPLAAVETARIQPTEDDCCRPGCKTRCCGSMTCCATGVLVGPLGLSVDLFGAVTLIPDDVASHAGIGPEALPKPPRTLA
ncbi:hypothetical protein [Methylobacterium radiotolerans]|uniref:hypothetical protein n=1 Tax=Methylobacterium radiotolerans TaxID=31998 RepID=UPI000D5D8F13|nr:MULTISPECIES: hypothetical protein [Methylobacterium]MDE3749370.1 hypothetical protein [Methylobacterium radiotolerans]PVY93947.1 hypothetical protein C7388_13113 [Methylobacterium organophilum]